MTETEKKIRSARFTVWYFHTKAKRTHAPVYYRLLEVAMDELHKLRKQADREQQVRDAIEGRR